jgi:prepilin-type N-terminal cleavage/methylation domain-containing protein
MRESRGFTLVEILIALVIMGVVTGALYQVLNHTQRLSRAQAEQVSLQSNVRAGSLVVPSELRELNTVVGGVLEQDDILIAQPDRVRYRAMRGLYAICESPAAPTEVRVFTTDLAAYRDPVAVRDGLYVFIEGDPDKEQDDQWIQVPINVVITNNVCPGAVGAVAGIRLITPNTPALVGLAVGTPVRVYEVMELKLGVVDGRSWLTAQSISGGDPAPNPVLGPLTDADGFGLRYFDANGAVTGDVNAIKSIEVTVRGITDEVVRINGSGAMGHPQETLVSQVLLRNSIRP